jgi:hypothetical protein
VTTLLWITVPYVAFTSFVLGHLWRYRHDQFGWTTLSSQLYESRLLRLGSPLFHFGLLAVLFGHVLGIIIPASWTAALGVSEHAYHLLSVSFGTLSGLATVAGLAILLYRRITVPAVRKATTTLDKGMYLLLSAAIVSGMLRLPGDSVTLVPQPVHPLAAARGDGGHPAQFPNPQPGGAGPAGRLALHPPGARLQRTAGLPGPTLRRVPQPRCRPPRRAPLRPRLGGIRTTCPTPPFHIVERPTRLSCHRSSPVGANAVGPAPGDSIAFDRTHRLTATGPLQWSGRPSVIAPTRRRTGYRCVGGECATGRAHRAGCPPRGTGRSWPGRPRT